MTTESYLISPSGGGDGDQLMRKIGAASQSVTEVAGFVGSQLVGFFQHPTACFFRFEVTVPEGATINGIQLVLKTAASGTLGPIDLVGGFCKRQGGLNAWELASGLGAWSTDTDVPFGEANTFTGVQTYSTVWWGDAPAFEDDELEVVTGVSQTWSIGEGTLTGGTAADVTGMVSQLQSYLDDETVSATRGDTVAGAVSVLFQIYRHYAGTSSQSQPLRFSDHTNTGSHPVLKVDWTLDREITGALDLVPAVSGGVDLTPAVSGTESLLASVSGDVKLG